MKKLLASISILFILTSCYNTRLYVGNVSTSDQLEEVNSVWTSHVLFGLAPLGSAKQSAKDYLPEGQENYVIKTNTSFVNGLVSGITFGIYTPTTTKYYVPKK